MFSREYDKEITTYFNRRMELLKERCSALDRKENKLTEEERGLLRFGRSLLKQKTEEIYGALSRCGEEEAQALRFLYSSMPLSDLFNYPAAVFMAYAAHGAFLWREGPFAGKVPEKLFANYVLHHRVHNEDIADTRRFFYEMLRKRTAGKNMYDAAVEVNFWCGENATYQSTFMRTQNPVTMYGTAAGRCGEEAPFAATALRCLGIPAREVAAPFWAHCDDNHAWVEAWCDGKWHFLGGCEPAEHLDEGWFSGPASRAMLIDSTWFGQDKPCEPAAGRSGMAARVNHLALYAHTAKVTVHVEDEQGMPVPGARVDFTVLNFSRFNSVATLYTGEEGSGEYGAVSLDIGCGDMLVSAAAEGCYGETIVSLSEEKGRSSAGGPAREYTIVLKKEMQALDEWRELDLRAPAEILRSEYKTDEEAAAENARLEYAAKCRQQKIAAFYPEREAERVLMRFAGKDREVVRDILCQACANAGEIIRFLEWDFAGQTAELDRTFGGEHWKVEALLSLRKNDYWDIRAEVLAECSILAAPYAHAFPQDIFFRDLLCPCVTFEMARPGRATLAKALGGLKQKIRENPQCLPAMLDAWMISLPEEEYANLVTSPVGCLTGGMASPHSRMILCANMFRALGIPARFRMMDRTLEYYADGTFVPLRQSAFEKQAGKGKIVVRMEAPLKMEDWRHYSLSRFEEGHFMPLFLRPGGRTPGAEEAGTKPDHAEFDLEQGIYRIVTTNRLPNGGQFVKNYDFRLQENEVKQIAVSMREIPVEALLTRMPVKDIPLHEEDGEERMLSELSGNGRSLFLWLELSKEPTEHILNELCEKREQSGGLAVPVYFVVRKGADYKGDGTLRKACAAIPQARVLLDDFGEDYKAFSFQVGRNPGKFPLAVIMEDGKEAIYSDSGYNVGMSEPLLRILTVTQPFAAGCMGSRRFRIPSLMVTGAENLLAVCDARWNHGLDSAGNLETVAARSTDNGYSWERQFVNHFDDVEDGSDRCIFSAGFIDPVLGKDSQGTIYLLADLCPAFVGAYAAGGIVCGQQNGGRHPNGRLALRDMGSYTHAEPLELEEETYPYYAGEPGADGYMPVLRLADGLPLGNYLLDDEMYLYRRTAGAVEKVMIPQLSERGEMTSRMIHANVFFAASPIKAYPAFHIVCRTSRDDGKTWSRMRFVGEQIGARGFTAVCPGKGYACLYEGRERVIFPIYDNNLGTEFASVIYTEDAGLTWKRGRRAEETGFQENGELVKSSESQIVEMPDGSLRMYSRNLIREITYTDSLDGGVTWSEYKREPQLRYCGNCMVSVINCSHRIEGKSVLLASYPEGDDVIYHRVNGRIAVGLVDEETKTVDWKYHYPVNNAPFYYSCLAELPDGRIALWYEYEEYAVRLEVFSLEKLIQEGKV